METSLWLGEPGPYREERTPTRDRTDPVRHRQRGSPPEVRRRRETGTQLEAVRRQICVPREGTSRLCRAGITSTGYL